MYSWALRPVITAAFLGQLEPGPPVTHCTPTHTDDVLRACQISPTQSSEGFLGHPQNICLCGAADCPGLAVLSSTKQEDDFHSQLEVSSSDLAVSAKISVERCS